MTPELAKVPQIPPPCDLTLANVCIGKPEPGVTVWRMSADERFANAVGVMQGGFIAALCDSAMGASSISWAAANNRERKVVSYTTDMRVSFIKAVELPCELECTARIIAGGRRVLFGEAEVNDESGCLVAKASATFMIADRH